MSVGSLVILDGSYKLLVEQLGGRFSDVKPRPCYLCKEDEIVKGLFWIIPLSTVDNISFEKYEKIERFLKLEDSDIRSSYYEVGKIDRRKCLIKISCAFPVTQQYISHNFSRCGIDVKVVNQTLISKIEKKLKKILSYENQFPNRLEQHITDVKAHLIAQIGT
ncbi:MAG: hypothetical protein ACRC6X_08260 [Culicoidibacterales bacterium]